MSDPIDNFLNQEKENEKATQLARLLKLFKNDDDVGKSYRFNEFSRTPEHIDGREVTDNEIIEIRGRLTEKFNFSPAKENVYDGIVYYSLKNKYHPIKEYLEKLTWNGEPRLEKWLNTICGVEMSEYTASVGKIIFLAAVKRIYEPGCWYDYLPVLEGTQGIGKSKMIEKMAGGKKYYATMNFNKNDKDIIDLARGKWFLEVSEMAGFGRQETERVKAFLSTSVDTCRLSYGRLAQDFPRQWTMIGTYNPLSENKYFSDETGNRRYWPIECTGTIIPELMEDFRDEYFAEAMYLYRMGNEKIYLNEKIEEHAREKQTERLMIDPWIEPIAQFLDGRVLVNDGEITVHRVAADCLKIPMERLTRAVAIHIGRVIVKCGWIRKRKWNSDCSDRIYYYVPPGKEFYDDREIKTFEEEG